MSAASSAPPLEAITSSRPPKPAFHNRDFKLLMCSAMSGLRDASIAVDDVRGYSLMIGLSFEDSV